MRTYHPEFLFDLSQDEIAYKYSNSVNNIFYNHNNSTIKINKEASTPYLYYEELAKLPFIKHGFSTRLGGVSTDVFTSLNLSFSRGDEEESVKINYKRILQALDMADTSLMFSDQVHNTEIYQVVEEDECLSKDFEKHLEGIDGLITNVPNVTLITSYADCVPLYIIDPVHKAIGLSHSGWKGTVNKIGKKTIEAMAQAYGTKPGDVICAIGPSICFDCYEISEDVANAFEQAFSHDITDRILYNKGNGKYQLDLWMTNQEVLKEAGVKEENIINSNLCTCCNSALLFSHRASNGQRGNLAAFLSINSRQ